MCFDTTGLLSLHAMIPARALNNVVGIHYKKDYARGLTSIVGEFLCTRVHAHTHKLLNVYTYIYIVFLPRGRGNQVSFTRAIEKKKPSLIHYGAF